MSRWALLLAICGGCTPVLGEPVREYAPDTWAAAVELWEATEGPMSRRCVRAFDRVRVQLEPRDVVALKCGGACPNACIEYPPVGAGDLTAPYPLIIADEDGDVDGLLMHELGHLGAHCARGPWDYGHCSAYYEALGEECRPELVPRVRGSQ